MCGPTPSRARLSLKAAEPMAVNGKINDTTLQSKSPVPASWAEGGFKMHKVATGIYREHPVCFSRGRTVHRQGAELVQMGWRLLSLDSWQVTSACLYFVPTGEAREHPGQQEGLRSCWAGV